MFRLISGIEPNLERQMLARLAYEWEFIGPILGVETIRGLVNLNLTLHL